MDFIKKYKYWIGGAAGLVVIGFLLIQLGLVGGAFTSQAMFFLTFAVMIAGGFAILTLIRKYF